MDPIDEPYGKELYFGVSIPVLLVCLGVTFATFQRYRKARSNFTKGLFASWVLITTSTIFMVTLPMVHYCHREDFRQVKDIYENCPTRWATALFRVLMDLGIGVFTCCCLHVSSLILQNSRISQSPHQGSRAMTKRIFTVLQCIIMISLVAVCVATSVRIYSPYKLGTPQFKALTKAEEVISILAYGLPILFTCLSGIFSFRYIVLLKKSMNSSQKLTERQMTLLRHSKLWILLYFISIIVFGTFGLIPWRYPYVALAYVVLVLNLSSLTGLQISILRLLKSEQRGSMSASRGGTAKASHSSTSGGNQQTHRASKSVISQ